METTNVFGALPRMCDGIQSGLKGWIANARVKHVTLKLLGNCREDALKDIGLTAADVDAAGRAADACEALLSAAGSRSGNW